MLEDNESYSERYAAFFCFLKTYKPKQLKNFAHNVGYDLSYTNLSKNNLCMELVFWLRENEGILFDVKNGLP